MASEFLIRNPRAGSCDEVSHEAALARGSLSDCDRALADPVMAAQMRLDLLRLDPYSGDLRLQVYAPAELERAVG